MVVALALLNFYYSIPQAQNIEIQRHIGMPWQEQLTALVLLNTMSTKCHEPVPSAYFLFAVVVQHDTALNWLEAKELCQFIFQQLLNIQA